MSEKLSFYHRKGGNAPRPINLPGDYEYQFVISAHGLREISRKDGSTSEILTVTYRAVAPNGETPPEWSNPMCMKLAKVDYWTDEESLWRFEDILQRGFGISMADHEDYEAALNAAVRTGAACAGKLVYKVRKNDPERADPAIKFKFEKEAKAA
jgi:hypothetical protein